MSRPFMRGLALILLFSSIAASLRAGDAPLPADLALVPADGVGFLHVRLGDLFKSEHFKDFRDTLLQAGDDALAAFDHRFVPAPSSIDRLTVALSRNNAFQQEPDLIVILATTRPIDREAFLQHTAAGAQKQQVGGKTFYEVPKLKIGLYFADDRTLVLGPAEAVHRSLRQAPARQGELAAALAQAQQGKPLVVAVNVDAVRGFVPPAALQQVPPPFQPLLQARLATLTLDLARQGQVDFRLAFANAQQAEDAERSIQAGLQLARTALAKGREEMRRKVIGDGKPASLQELPEAAASLVGLGVAKRLDDLLAAPPLKKQDASLAVSVPLPQGGAGVVALGAISTGLLVPAVQKVREAAARTQDANNLKQMALAMHIHADATRKGFPAAAICDRAGKPLLSWRVAILPYIEQDQLYRQFKLDEPWDSEHNHKLIPLMPQIYAVPTAPTPPGETHYRVFVGGGALFDLDKQVRFPQITDGTSNTVLIVETAASVPWTKPDDIAYDVQRPLPKLGRFFPNGYNVAFADGSVRFLSTALPEATWRALITRAGGEVIPRDQ
jgi:prepilin-type processing-associated H-X9-DG protein